MKHAMQQQSDPLNLQSLPLASPPRDGWPAIEAALKQDRRRRTVRHYALAALAAVASLTLVLTLVSQRPAPDPLVQAPEQVMAQTADQQQSETGRVAPPVPETTLAALIALSQRLEGRLRTIRSGVGALPAHAVVYQVELEDLVVQVDEELSTRPDSLALWNQRVSLLLDLERLYENSLRREYQQMASL